VKIDKRTIVILAGLSVAAYLDSGVHHRVAPRAYRGEFRRAILPRATTAAH
jgi:hypothetical protein